MLLAQGDISDMQPLRRRRRDSWTIGAAHYQRTDAQGDGRREQEIEAGWPTTAYSPAKAMSLL